MEKKTGGFPLAHVLGFLGALLMTFAASFIALKTSFSYQAIMWIIGSLAIIQAGLQLFMFMHVNEGEEKKIQLINIAYGVFMAVVIVAGTIWVMSFGLHDH
ncbi:MAG: subunit of cytochrome aa3 quinol oxidase [Paenibacillaceae bacterium]|jgi:cytochrome aa3-600 menaquinol oxidase subunit 4|nr:subunit of cytochrome aa3 quinol oxidase [Paenibacillaceae bacterium]